MDSDMLILCPDTASEANICTRLRSRRTRGVVRTTSDRVRVMRVHPLDGPKGNARSRTTTATATATATKDYVRRVRIACDDLHNDPLNPTARAAQRAVIKEDVPTGHARQQSWW
jgi:hypothetical protein